MTDNPKDNELELSIFGPGYGEAIALHIGSGNWILVDSCLEPISGQPAQLRYLKNLGIDPSKSVKLIVSTHWHDDHIQGIGSLIRECKSAEVTVSGAINSEYFSALIDSYETGSFPGSSGVTEFINVFRALDERRENGNKINVAKLAVPDKLLYRDTTSINGNDYEIEIHSLSPSDASILRAHADFVNLIPVAGQNKKRIVAPSTNNTSVVLWVKIGEKVILLGADLENTSDPKTGWTVIINESQTVKGKAAIYKVAHHGAESSHNQSIWTQLLIDKPYAILSSYMIGDNFLPKPDDIKRLTTLTPNAYITAPPKTKEYRTSDRVVKDTIKNVTKSMRSVNIGWGQVRLRSGIEPSSGFSIELFGDAQKIENS